MSEQTLGPPRHEKRDVGAGFAIAAVGVMGGSLILSAVVLAVLFPQTLPTRYVPTKLPTQPQPALQSTPRSDMDQFFAEEMRQLNSYGWTDKSRGRVHIPIEEAMRRLAAQGIPGWPEAGK